ncbi:MAG: hypothetical protein HYT64_02500 [Candidatus Yanofskybacteria bacterium]|nr:hypothetical protein [Candidatus Yanofskybacteria bacterium]
MNKTRGLLSFVALLTIIGQVFVLHSHLPNDWKFFLHVADGILLLSALTMLLFSFFRVGVTTDGELCYNPDNWYWKTMAWFYDKLSDPYSSSFSQGKVSLCKSFWMTAGVIFVVTGLLVLVGLLTVSLWDAYWKYGLLKMFYAALGFVVLAAAVIGVICGLVVGAEKISNKIDDATHNKHRLRNAMATTKTVAEPLFLFGFFSLFLVIFPIMIIAVKFKVSFFTAIVYYLVGVTGLVLTIGGAVLLIWFVFKYLPGIIGNTVLGQFLSAKKKQFCPTLTRCCASDRKDSFS